MEKYTSWREMLNDIIRDGQERQKIAGVVGINAVTLGRWASNTSRPRYQHLRRLLLALSQQHRAEMQELIAQEFPDFPLGLELNKQDEEQDLISSDLYARVFHTYASAPHAQRSWNVANLILRHALERLDPQQQGMAITLVQCIPPSEDGKVYSLRERMGFGTSPWPPNLEPYAIFLGLGSLSGYVVGRCQHSVVQNRSKEQQGLRPIHWDKWEKGAAAYPIYRESRVAGCLLVSSALPDYFSSHRQKLIEQYAELLSLVFEPGEFYPVEHINLRAMPEGTEQQPYLFTYRQRVSDMMLTVLRGNENIDVKHAEVLTWKEIEQELAEFAIAHSSELGKYYSMHAE